MPELRGLLENNDRTHSGSNSDFSQRNTAFSFQFEISFVLLRFRGCFLISNGVSSCFVWVLFSVFSIYRKIPKISPSMYKTPQTGNAKNPPLNRLSKYKPPGGLYLEN